MELNHYLLEIVWIVQTNQLNAYQLYLRLVLS